SPAQTMDAALAGSAYVTEVEVPEGWASAKPRVGDLHALAEGDVSVMALMRGGKRQASPHANTHLRPGDRLLLEGAQQALEDLIARAKLKLTRSDRPVVMEEPSEEIRVVEAVVNPGASLIGESAQRLNLYGGRGVTLLAVSRSGYRLRQTLRSVRFRNGDIVLLQGGERSL